MKEISLPAQSSFEGQGKKSPIPRLSDRFLDPSLLESGGEVSPHDTPFARALNSSCANTVDSIKEASIFKDILCQDCF